MNNPLVVVAMLVIGLYVAKLWWADKRMPQSRGLPGAAPTTSYSICIAIAGALVLLAIETVGEKALGIADQQSTMTWLFAAYSILAAPILEELVFRGYLVIEGRGKAALWAGAVGASLIFGAIHPFLWRNDDAGFALTLTSKGFFSTAMVVLMSLWLYASRFGAWNASRSLLPCFVAHAAKNAGVVVVKATTGYMGSLW